MFINLSVVLSLVFVSSEAFTNLSVKRSNQLYFHNSKTQRNNILYASSERDDIVDTEKETGIPCLPPIGESSFIGQPAKDSEVIRLDGTSQAVNHVGTEKFELQYTCNICETRNTHRVSRMAYRNGIVITICNGCMSKHLIADNLGWTNYPGGFNGDTNIEEFMETLGRSEEVNRVTPEIFDLEKMIHENNVEAEISCPDDTIAFE